MRLGLPNLCTSVMDILGWWTTTAARYQQVMNRIRREVASRLGSPCGRRRNLGENGIETTRPNPPRTRTGMRFGLVAEAASLELARGFVTSARFAGFGCVLPARRSLSFPRADHVRGGTSGERSRTEANETTTETRVDSLPGQRGVGRWRRGTTIRSR